MTGMSPSPPPSVALIVRLWQRTPVAIRAILAGLIVFSIMGNVALGLIVWLLPLPWSGLAIAIALGVYLRYFSGHWWPESTNQLRRVRFRSSKLPTNVWMWSLTAALLAVVVVESSVVVLSRLLDSTVGPSGPELGLSDPASWQIWLFILMASAVAGISEEVGFRGYMQVPLERRYGPGVGIAITSLVFVLFHLNQAWASGIDILLILFVAGAMWGVMVFTSGSLIPAMMSHIMVDIFYFSYWWTDFSFNADRGPIGETGIDSHFVVWLSALVAAALLFVLATRKTLAARREA